MKGHIMKKPLKVLIIADRAPDAKLLLAHLKPRHTVSAFRHVDTMADVKSALTARDWDAVICEEQFFDLMNAFALVKACDINLPFIIASTDDEKKAAETMELVVYESIVRCDLTRLASVMARELQRAEVRRSEKEGGESRERNDERLRMSLNAARIGVWELNLLTDEVVWSEGVETLLRLPQGAFPGAREAYLNRVYPDDLEKLNKAFARAVEHGGRYRVEHRIVWPDGELRWLVSHGQVHANSAGEPVSLVGALMDITEKKRKEEELRERNALLEKTLAELKTMQGQMIQQERLHALETLASAFAHDFNNVLAPILGYSELLLRRPEAFKDWEAVKRQVEIIRGAAMDAAAMVCHLKKFYCSRDESEVFQVVYINKLIEVVTQLTRPKWKDQAQADGRMIHVSHDLQEIPPILGKESDLCEAMTNLILNAVDAIPDEGEITIRTRTDGNNVFIEVTDTGIGMTEEVRARCFEPLFSTKGKDRTGLGLSMAYGVIKRHNGEISVQSERGAGTTFAIRLPLSEIVDCRL
jgi:signal transduction histidine kinase